MSEPAQGHSTNPARADRRPRKGAAVAAAGLSLALITGAIGWTGWSYWNSQPLRRAERAYARGDWSATAAQALHVLRSAPNEPAATALLARAQARLGHDALARDLYRRLDPSQLGAEDYFLVARGFLAAGELEQGRVGLEKALAADSRHAESLNALVALDRRMDRLEDAASAAAWLARVPGWEARGLVLRGQLQQALGDPGAAAASFRQALERDPALAGEDSTSPDEVRLALARCLLQAGKPAEARAALKRLLANHRNEPAASWLLSRCALQEHNLAAANEALARAGDYGSAQPEAFEPAPYVGTARCGECHAEKARAQAASRHARTFHPRGNFAELPLPGKPLPDPGDAQVTHTLTREGPDLHFRTHTPSGDMQALVEFVMGSGDRAYTLVGRDQKGAWRELRLTYYDADAVWDRTTGQHVHPQANDHFLGPVQEAEALRRCIGCHTTRGPVAVDSSGKGLPGERGFSCERCHGPAGNHLAAADLGCNDPAIGRPRLAAPARVDALCAQCHGAQGRGVTTDNPNLARFQSSSLPLSRCSTTGGEPLSCLDCHDPHRNAETSAAFYEAKCLKCHAGGPSASEVEGAQAAAADRTACPVSTSRGCISCHMPQVITGVPHTTFTDHYIQVHRDKDRSTSP